MCTNTPTRRRCLLAIGGAGPLGVAGCLGFDDGDDEPHADAGPYEDSPEPAVTLHSTEVRVTNMGSAVAVFCSDAAIDSTEDIDNGENGATRSDATFPCDGESVVALSEDGSIGVVTTMSLRVPGRQLAIDREGFFPPAESRVYDGRSRRCRC